MRRIVLHRVAIDACDARSNVNKNESTMADWVHFGLIVFGMICATVFTRSAFLLLPTRWQLSQGTLAALRYAPMAAIAAIVVPDLISWRPAQAELQLTDVLSPKLISATIAAVVHWRYANMLLSIAVGMSVFWGLRLALGSGLMG